MSTKDAFVPQGANDSVCARVLMADPDVSLHSVYRDSLLREGFELTTAVTGLECIARLSERTPDVLVLDPHLPWGGGDGVLAIMGESPDFAMVPVMILTSRRDSHILDGMKRFPIADYHVKPLAPDRLAARLRGFLDHPRLRFALNDRNGRLECAIVRRTDGRIRGLRVDIRDGNVIIRGHTESYYIKQLVLAAALDAIEASQWQGFMVESEIEVCGDSQSTTSAMCVNSNGTQESLRGMPVDCLYQPKGGGQ